MTSKHLTKLNSTDATAASVQVRPDPLPFRSAALYLDARMQAIKIESFKGDLKHLASSGMGLGLRRAVGTTR
jgi:hypothetical protein